MLLENSIEMSFPLFHSEASQSRGDDELQLQEFEEDQAQASPK